jgi:dienelactone hydrolase
VYPTDATPPFAGVAICPGFLNTGPEMAEWGPFYASHGIVTLVTNTGAADIPEIRASKLAAAVNALKAENTKSGSPLNGKMAGRYGTSGYSMGGGGTLLTATDAKNQLLTSVGLAPWGGTGTGIKAATLLFCGDLDVVAPCAYADSAYGSIPAGTNKMMITISGCDHLACWFGPGDAGRGTSGGYALAWQKAFLEGDERWKEPLLKKPSSASDYKTTLK